MTVSKELEKVLIKNDLENLIEFLEEDSRLPISQFDDLGFMDDINQNTEYYARLDSSTDYILIDLY